jgi:hypothetical protein
LQNAAFHKIIDKSRFYLLKGDQVMDDVALPVSVFENSSPVGPPHLK